MKRPLLAAIVALAVAIPATAGAATAPAISITSPAAGSSFSRSAFDTIPVSGTVAFDVAPPEDRTYYLRGSGCGATESFWLSVTSATDEYDGCGVIGGLPAEEVFLTENVFGSTDGVPVLLDASKNVNGTIRAESWFGDDVPGAGQVIIDVSLSGTKSNNQTAFIGSATEEALNSGSGGIQIPFSLDIPANLDRVYLKAITFSVTLHGLNYNSGNLGLSGDSRFTLPIFDPGRVDVSSDSATFSAAKTVQAAVNADGTWNAEIAVPNTGPRKIYARAVQGTLTTNAAPVSITITA